MNRTQAFDQVINEIDRNQRRYPEGFGGSVHRALGVMEEEMHEWRMEIFKRPSDRDKGAMRREAVQIAATAILFMEELT